MHFLQYICFVCRSISNISIPSFSNSAACSSAVRKPAISLADSTDLRVLLNIMYLMVETIQKDDPADKPEWKIIRETFRAELGKFHQSQMLCHVIVQVKNC